MTFKPSLSAVLISGFILAGQAFAQDMQPAAPIMYGTAPAMTASQSGHYPAPPMSPQMMQQMMTKQQQQMQHMQKLQQQRQTEAQAQQQQMQEMQKQRQAEAGSQQPPMAKQAQQQRAGSYKKNCKHHEKKLEMQQARRAKKDAHMQRVEKSLANIEKLMQEMITLMKSR